MPKAPHKNLLGQTVHSEASSDGAINFRYIYHANASYNLFTISRGGPETYSQEIGLNQIFAMISLAGMFSKLGITPNNIIAEYDVHYDKIEESSLHCAAILQHVFQKEFNHWSEITKFYTRGFGVAGNGHTFPLDVCNADGQIDGMNIVYIAPYKYAGLYRTPAGAGYVKAARNGEYVKSPEKPHLYFSGDISMPDGFNTSMNQMGAFAGEEKYKKTIISAVGGLKLQANQEVWKVDKEKITFPPEFYTAPENMLEITDQILDYDKSKVLLGNPFQEVLFDKKILAFSK